MIYYFPEIPGSLTLTLLMILFYGVLLFGLLVVADILLRFIWFCIKDPVRDIYFVYLNFKRYREKTKYSRKYKKKKEWYEDYSNFR